MAATGRNGQGILDPRKVNAVASIPIPTGSMTNKIKVQSCISHTVHASSENGLADLIAQRLGRYFPAAVPILASFEWIRLQVLLRRHAGHVATTVIKTWLGAWTTSRRMHEPTIMKCFLGCDHEDNMSHYFQCVRFSRCFGANACEILLSSRLGLTAKTRSDLKYPVVAFLAYHEVKHGI